MQSLIDHVSTPPQPPSQHVMGVPPWLDGLVLACLAKAADDRPRDADAVLQRLGAFDAAPAWTNARARDWWQLHLPVAADDAATSQTRGMP